MTHDNKGNDLGSCRIELEKHSEEEDFFLKNLDRLDKISFGALVVIVIAGALLIVSHPGHESSGESINGGARQAVVIISPEFDNKLKVANTLLAGGNLTKARELIKGMIEDFPYDGRPYMLMGDLYVREQQPVMAMLEYRKGVDLNPDFLDKKTRLFRGKQIKNILEEARTKIAAGLENNPEDIQSRERLEILYYMLRRVAGSCG